MTLSALGIFSAAGAGGGVSLSDYELISTTILGTATSSVTFDVTGLGSTYKHLQIRALAKSSSTNNNANLRFNGVTTTSYSFHTLYGTGSAVESAAITSATSIANIVNMPPSQFGASVIDILDAFSSTKNKTVRYLSGMSDGGGVQSIALNSGLFISTSPTTSLTITGGVNLATGSRFSIYGLRG